MLPFATWDRGKVILMGVRGKCLDVMVSISICPMRITEVLLWRELSLEILVLMHLFLTHLMASRYVTLLLTTPMKMLIGGIQDQGVQKVNLDVQTPTSQTIFFMIMVWPCISMRILIAPLVRVAIGCPRLGLWEGYAIRYAT